VVSLHESFVTKVRSDIRKFSEATKSPQRLTFLLKLIFITPGFQFALLLRTQEACGRIPLVGRIARRILWYLTCLAFSSEVAPSAEIGAGVYFPHPYGIVLGACRLGHGVEILQGVTVGKRYPDKPEAPIIEDECRIGAGAKILGNVRVGSKSEIGANAVVIEDVPPNSLAVGVPARIMPLDRS
jgi:serine O-acetyltransferase